MLCMTRRNYNIYIYIIIITTSHTQHRLDEIESNKKNKRLNNDIFIIKIFSL